MKETESILSIKTLTYTSEVTFPKFTDVDKRSLIDFRVDFYNRKFPDQLVHVYLGHLFGRHVMLTVLKCDWDGKENFLTDDRVDFIDSFLGGNGKITRKVLETGLRVL